MMTTDEESTGTVPNKSMEEEKKDSSMEVSSSEEENAATFTNEGSPRLVIRQMVSNTQNAEIKLQMTVFFNLSFSSVVTTLVSYLSLSIMILDMTGFGEFQILRWRTCHWTLSQVLLGRGRSKWLWKI
jgi:hypothetical protein